jgi:hypothetical protein
MVGIQKQQYVIRRVGKNWEVIFLATGRSVGQRYTREEARMLKNQCNQRHSGHDAVRDVNVDA